MYHPTYKREYQRIIVVNEEGSKEEDLSVLFKGGTCREELLEENEGIRMQGQALGGFFLDWEVGQPTS